MPDLTAPTAYITANRWICDPSEWAEYASGTWLDSLYDFAVKLNFFGVDRGEIAYWTDQAAYQGMGWVRQGLLIYQIFRSHKWREDELEDGGFPPQRWGDWCAAALKMSAWSVRKLMDGARVVHELMDLGFTVLPRCLAQAEALIPYWKGKKDIDLFDAWAAVMEDHPLPQHMTANSIKGALGEVDPPQKRRIGLSGDTYEALRQRAALEGVTTENMIRDLLGLPPRKDHRDNTPPNLIPDPAPPEPEPYPEPEPEAVARWQEDLQTLAKQKPLTSKTMNENPIQKLLLVWEALDMAATAPVPSTVYPSGGWLQIGEARCEIEQLLLKELNGSRYEDSQWIVKPDGPGVLAEVIRK